MYWFTGTNLIERAVATNHAPFSVRSDSVDGNPGRPVRLADLMSFDSSARICWLALCSGTTLKNGSHKIYPPNDIWKESNLAYSGWSEETVGFDDGLGLPKSLRLVTTNDQSVVYYQTRQSTNVLGWNFPLEFYLVQYTPTASNAWKLETTAKGRITAIGPGARPQLGAEALRAAKKY